MMKRTFARRKALISRGTTWLGLAVLAFTMLVLLIRFLLPGVFLSVSAPLFRASSSVSASIGGLSSGFNNAAALTKERDALASQNVALAGENGVLSARIADLEATLGASEAPAPGIIAGVIARPPQSPYDTLVVAAGKSAGVEAGDTVRAAGGLPIGSVVAVSASAARVLLYSAPNVSTPGWLGESRLPIQLEGEGGGAFTARVPRAASSTPDELVYIAGPGSLPIGKVKGESGDPSSPFITFAIAASVNIFSITTVVITHSHLAP